MLSSPDNVTSLLPSGNCLLIDRPSWFIEARVKKDIETVAAKSVADGVAIRTNYSGSWVRAVRIVGPFNQNTPTVTLSFTLRAADHVKISTIALCYNEAGFGLKHIKRVSGDLFVAPGKDERIHVEITRSDRFHRANKLSFEWLFLIITLPNAVGIEIFQEEITAGNYVSRVVNKPNPDNENLVVPGNSLVVPGNDLVAPGNSHAPENSNVSVSPPKDYHHTAIGQARLNEIVQILRAHGVAKSNLLIKTKYKADLGKIGISNPEKNVTGIHIRELQGWVRLIFPFQVDLSRKLEKNEEFVASIPVNAHEPCVVSGLRIAFVSDDGKLVFGASQINSKELPAGENHLAYRFIASDLIDQPGSTDTHREALLVVELTSPGKFAVGAIQVSIATALPNVNGKTKNTIEADLAAYLVDFPRIARSNKTGALLEALELSRRLGLFEVAGKIFDKVEARSDELGNDQKLRFVRQSLPLLSVLGRNTDVEKLVVDHHALIKNSEALYDRSLSILYSLGINIPEMFESKKKGFKRGLVTLDEAESKKVLTRFFTGELPIQGASDYLMLANCVVNVNKALYKVFISKYISSYGLSGVESIGSESDNTLRNLKFSKPAARRNGEQVSVIITCFNSEDTVNYAISSILDQSYQNVELLICDDGSTDGTVERLKEWVGHPKIRMFVSKANQGPYNIRNALVAQARSDLVTFHDSDDLAHPQRLERQIEGLHKTGATGVLTRHIRVRPNGEVVFFGGNRAERVAPVTMLARRQSLIECGNFRSVLCGADSEMIERLKSRFGEGSLLELEEPLLLALWAGQSLTQQQGMEIGQDGFMSTSRRVYRELATFQRLLGETVIPNERINKINQANGIYREFAGIKELRG